MLAFMDKSLRCNSMAVNIFRYGESISEALRVMSCIGQDLNIFNVTRIDESAPMNPDK